MIPYSGFQLSSEDIEKIKDRNYRRSLAEYIKTHGAQPDDETAYSFRTVSAEDIEAERRILYAFRSPNPKASHDWSQDPLTFEILSAGKLVLTSRYTPYYSYNKIIEIKKNNQEWEEVLFEGWCQEEISVVAGDTVQFRADSDTSYAYYNFSSTCDFNILGNLMSLRSKTNFSNMNFSGNMQGLFSYCTGLIDASYLVLPAVPNDDYAYSYMFENCTNLMAAPILSSTDATTSGSYCYRGMFYNCKKLSELTCLMEVNGSNNRTSNWLYGVSNTGRFIKSPNSNWIEGSSGIPSGWTIVDYEE